MARTPRATYGPSTQGVAMFARAGARPLFLGLQFRVPLPDQLSVNSTPDVYHLVELKDTYHRYVVLIATEESARILEVNLGAITSQLWADRPELRERVGREWTHDHYQNHRRDRGDRFLKEKIEILKSLMAAGGHTHLILAGSPRMTARVRTSLPKHLHAKLVDVVPASSSSHVTAVVAATLSSFIEHEQQESREAVVELVGALRRGGLAAAGSNATLNALQRGQADVLIMAHDYEPGRAWVCGPCGWIDASSPQSGRCPQCASRAPQAADLKEMLVALAERQSREVEFVQDNSVLTSLGGVGCLLRYATPDRTPASEDVGLNGAAE
jgi:rubrerythrin